MSPSFRTISDAADLKALAHPLRMDLLESLVLNGPRTATQLAAELGSSPSNCSWHLRKLAEHELIEEAEGGTGRQRPWQMREIGLSWGAGDADPEERRAGDALSRVMLQRWVDRFLDATERADGEWRDAATATQSMGWLTAAELREVNERVQEVIRGFEDRLADPELRPEGSRLVELVAFASAVEMTR